MNIVIAIVLAAGSVGLVAYWLLLQGPAYRSWQRYSEHLAQYFSILFIARSASALAASHMVTCALLLFVALLTSSATLGLMVPILALAPSMVLDSKVRKKREAISEQLAPWLTILANSLKSSPNITDAFASSTGLVQSPLREEIDLLVKEVQLGEHLDRAMQSSAARLQSPLYSSVMTTLLVARMSGGNLPKILVDSSDTLREMERLAGVVRTKTAEGRSQAFVLALLPFVMIMALQKVDPEMIPGLAETSTGCIIIGASIALWVSAIALAMRIVKVDI
jgi:tight adherence protein B